MFFEVTSERFLSELERRAEAVAASEPIISRIVVSDDLRWWYFQEFGTTRFYPIFPVAAKALSWPAEGGGKVVVGHVDKHPPLKARHMVSSVLERIEEEIQSSVMQALVSSGYEAQAVQIELRTSLMPRVKSIIAESFEQQLPGVRPDGKLGGRTAAQAFEDDATVV